MKFGVGVFVVVLVACTSSSEIEVDRAHCTQLRDHLVDLRVATVPKGKQIDVTGHRAAMKQALGDSFIGSCQAHLGVAELECGLRARDFASATACASSK